MLVSAFSSSSSSDAMFSLQALDELLKWWRDSHRRTYGIHRKDVNVTLFWDSKSFTTEHRASQGLGKFGLEIHLLPFADQSANLTTYLDTFKLASQHSIQHAITPDSSCSVASIALLSDGVSCQRYTLMEFTLTSEDPSKSEGKSSYPPKLTSIPIIHNSQVLPSSLSTCIKEENQIIPLKREVLEAGTVKPPYTIIGRVAESSATAVSILPCLLTGSVLVKASRKKGRWPGTSSKRDIFDIVPIREIFEHLRKIRSDISHKHFSYSWLSTAALNLLQNAQLDTTTGQVSFFWKLNVTLKQATAFEFQLHLDNVIESRASVVSSSSFSEKKSQEVLLALWNSYNQIATPQATRKRIFTDFSWLKISSSQGSTPFPTLLNPGRHFLLLKGSKVLLSNTLTYLWARGEAGIDYKLVLALSFGTLEKLQEASLSEFVRAEYQSILSEEILAYLVEMIKDSNEQDIFFILDDYAASSFSSMSKPIQEVALCVLNKPNLLVTSNSYRNNELFQSQQFSISHLTCLSPKETENYIDYLSRDAHPRESLSSSVKNDLKKRFKGEPLLQEVSSHPTYLQLMCTIWLDSLSLSRKQQYLSLNDLLIKLSIELYSLSFDKEKRSNHLGDRVEEREDVLLNSIAPLFATLEHFSFSRTVEPRKKQTLAHSIEHASHLLKREGDDKDSLEKKSLLFLDEDNDFAFYYSAFYYLFLARYLANCFIQSSPSSSEQLSLIKSYNHIWPFIESISIFEFITKNKYEDWFEKASPFMAGYFVRVGHFGALKSFLALLFSDENELVNLYSILVATKCLDEVWEPLVKEDLVFSNQLLELVCQWLYISLTTPGLFSPLNKFWFVLRSCRNLIEALSRNGIFKETGEGFTLYLGRNYNSVSSERLKDLNKVLDLEQSISYQDSRKFLSPDLKTMRTVLGAEKGLNDLKVDKKEMLQSLLLLLINHPDNTKIILQAVFDGTSENQRKQIKQELDSIFRETVGTELPRLSSSFLSQDPPRSYRALSENTIAFIMRLAQEGKSEAEIAQILQISPTSHSKVIEPEKPKATPPSLQRSLSLPPGHFLTSPSSPSLLRKPTFPDLSLLGRAISQEENAFFPSSGRRKT